MFTENEKWASEKSGTFVNEVLRPPWKQRPAINMWKGKLSDHKFRENNTKPICMSLKAKSLSLNRKMTRQHGNASDCRLWYVCIFANLDWVLIIVILNIVYPIANSVPARSTRSKASSTSAHVCAVRLHFPLAGKAYFQFVAALGLIMEQFRTIITGDIKVFYSNYSTKNAEVAACSPLQQKIF